LLVSWAEVCSQRPLDSEADAAGGPTLAADQARFLKADHRLVHDRAADLKEALHACLGRWPADHERVGVNKRQVLALSKQAPLVATACANPQAGGTRL